MNRRALPLALLLLLMLPFLTGALCGPSRRCPPASPYPEVAMAMVGDLDRQLVPRLGMYTRDNSRGLYWLVITTPADGGDLTQASPLTRMFAQEIASAFVALGYNVQEIRKACEIIESRHQGEFILTRDVRAQAARHATASLVVAGTYTVTPAGVRFSLEVVDARNNNIVAMSNRTLPMDATVESLLRGDGAAGYVEPTVSTVDHETFRREMLPYMTRHW